LADLFRSGRALVIGIANYPNVRKLPEAVLNDAREVANLLRSPAYCGYPDTQVKVLLDARATVHAIRHELRFLGRSAQPDDAVVVFFSGHGGRITTGPGAGNYLIPYDCEPRNLQETAIESAELTQLLSAIKSRRLVVLLDACHSAGTGNPKEAIEPDMEIKAGLGADVYNLLGTGSGRVVMASSREDEVSFVLPGGKHSLFTQELLNALRGRAAIPGEDVVRVFPVFRYVSDAVPAQEPNQHPNFKAHGLESDFALALNQGGKVATATPAVTRARPERLSRDARLELVDRLLDRWLRLALYFDVSAADRRRFRPGEEPIQLLDWIEARGRLGELLDGFNRLGWDDLIEVVDRHPTPPRRDPKRTRAGSLLYPRSLPPHQTGLGRVGCLSLSARS
jgi:metacaspase-1